MAYAGLMAAEKWVIAEEAVGELLAECGWSDDMTRRWIFGDGLPTGVGWELGLSGSWSGRTVTAVL